jgi:hypothetical protein
MPKSLFGVGVGSVSAFIRRTRITLDPLAFSSANTRRTPGVHLTDIVRDMLQLIGLARPRNDAQWPREKLDGMAVQGYLWEDAMTETLVGRVQRSSGAAIGKREQYVRLPEIACDGQRAFCIEYDEHTGQPLTPVPPEFVIMSPDGAILRDEAPELEFIEHHGMLVCPRCDQIEGECGCHGELALLECKWTTLSAPAWSEDAQERSDILSKFLEAKRPDWMWQTPCYLRGVGLAFGREVSEVQHHAQFACGDYKGSGVIYEEWMRRYSSQEVDDKWSAVYRHALDRGILK